MIRHIDNQKNELKGIIIIKLVGWISLLNLVAFRKGKRAIIL